MYSALVLAKREEAARVAAAEHPAREFDGVEASGLDPVKLAGLQAALTGHDEVPPHNAVLHEESDDEGPWVFEVSPPVVTELARLAPAEVAEAAALWMRDIDLQFDHWTLEEATRVTRALATLAARAKAEGKTVMLRQSW